MLNLTSFHQCSVLILEWFSSTRETKCTNWSVIESNSWKGTIGNNWTKVWQSVIKCNTPKCISRVDENHSIESFSDKDWQKLEQACKSRVLNRRPSCSKVHAITNSATPDPEIMRSTDWNFFFWFRSDYFHTISASKPRSTPTTLPSGPTATPAPQVAASTGMTMCCWVREDILVAEQTRFSDMVVASLNLILNLKLPFMEIYCPLK